MAPLLQRRWRERGLASYSWLLLAFLLLPVLVLVPVSFSSGSLLAFPVPDYSWRWYVEALSQPVWREALRNSLVVACASAACAAVLGTLAALGLRRCSAGWRNVVLGLALAPLVVPVVLIGLGGYLALARLGLNNSITGVVLLHTAMTVPYIVLCVDAVLRGLDPALDQAAASLGAAPVQRFALVTLPLILPGTLAGAAFAFVISFDEVVVASFIASPAQATLPLRIFSGVRENIGPVIAAVAVLLLLLSASLLLLVEVFLRRQSFALLQGARTRRGEVSPASPKGSRAARSSFGNPS